MLQHDGEAADRVEADGDPGAEGDHGGVEPHALQAEAGRDREGADHDALRVAGRTEERDRLRRKRTVLTALLQRFCADAQRQEQLAALERATDVTNGQCAKKSTYRSP